MMVAWHYQKTNSMKQKTVNREILLITGTSFSSRSSHKNNFSQSNVSAGIAENLEQSRQKK
jgi:hypothetical protein